MFTNFQASPHRRYLVTTRELRRFCKRAASIEEMALFWCTKPERTIIANRTDARGDYVTFSFYLKKRLIGTATSHSQELLVRYPEYTPLDETLLYFADQDGARPNDPWFEERSRRLQIVYSNEYGMNCAPAHSVPELVLSYVLSSAGFAEIRAMTGQPPHAALQVSLVFLGSMDGTGWTEDFIVSRADLINLAQVNRRSQPSLIH